MDHLYAFGPKQYGESAPFAWKSASNSEDVNWGGRHIMKHYYDREAGPELAILINMESYSVDFTLPEGRAWKRVLDTESYFDSEEYLTQEGLDRSKAAGISSDGPDVGASYGVTPHSIVVLRAE